MIFEPELQAFIDECFDNRIKTYEALKTEETTSWRGVRAVVSNRAAVERRVEALDNAIRQVRTLQRSPEKIDVELELGKIRAAMPSIASLNRTEKVETAAEARA